MDDYQTEEEAGFVVEDVSKIIKESVEAAIGGNGYQQNRVNQWTTSIVEQCLSQLSKLGKPFKYIVTCVIMQKNGAGLQTASACFWDNSTDGGKTSAVILKKLPLPINLGRVIRPFPNYLKSIYSEKDC